MSDNRTFVSYSSADSEFALKLASDLRASGADVWLDQLDIAAGSRWDSAVEDALRSSSRVLVVLSPKSVSSQNVLDEVSFALEEGKTVVPVLVETCTIPLRLRRLQYVDFTRGYDAGLTRLLATLGVELAAPPPRASPRPRRPVERAPAPPEPAPEPESETREPASATDPADAERPRRGLLLAAGAAVVAVVTLLGFWYSRSDRVEDSQATTTDAGPLTPVDTAAAQSAPPQQTPRESAPTAPPTGKGLAESLVTGTSVADPLAGIGGSKSGPLTGGESADAGLAELLILTQSLMGRSTLTAKELEHIARVQGDACRSTPSTSCASKASDTVQALFEAVCSRQIGPKPAADNEAASLKYTVAQSSCVQKTWSVVLDRLDKQAQDAIRRIKPG